MIKECYRLPGQERWLPRGVSLGWGGKSELYRARRSVTRSPEISGRKVPQRGKPPDAPLVRVRSEKLLTPRR